MANPPLLFVRKLVNSTLLPAFPASIRKILSHFSFMPESCKGLKLNKYRLISAIAPALPYYRPSMDIWQSGFRYTASLGVILSLFMTSLHAEVSVKNIEKNDKVVIGPMSERLGSLKQDSSKPASFKQLPSDQPVEKKTANNGLKYHTLYAEQWEVARSGESILSIPVLNQIINAWLGDRQKKIEIQYPGGEEGEVWVHELTDWLVSLGIPSDHLVVVPGSGADDVINFALIK